MASEDPPSQDLNPPGASNGSGRNPAASRDSDRRPPRSVPRNLSNKTSRGRQPTVNSRPQPQRPDFSLAGSYASPAQGNSSYVDPEYHDYNPNYNAQQNKPLWGLARPLPRVVRHGMRPEEEKEQQSGEEKKQKNGNTVVETQDAGETEAIPQVEKIPSQQRESDQDPENLQPRRRLSDMMNHSRSTNSNRMVGPSSPGSEIEDPMNSWIYPISETEEEGGSAAQKDRQAARAMYNNADLTEGPSRSEPESQDHSLDTPETTDDDATSRNLDAKLQWAADNDELDEYEAEEAEHNFNRWSSIRRRLREPLAECLGSMVATLIGLGVNLSVITSSDSSGTYQSENWGWGLGITLGIYIAGGISGGHLNPAISLLLSFYRGFPFPKACIYILAQIVGTFLAGLVAFAVYRPAIYHYSSTSSLIPSETGSAFYLVPTTWSGGGVGLGTGFLTEFVATAILAVAILALGDDSNAPPGAGMHALIVGLIVTVLTMAFGYTDGCGLNPARDIGPRMAAAAVGYGTGVFEGNDGWWVWGVWGGEIGGMLFGGFVYDAAIFVGGESPVNFPRRWWSRRWWWRRLRRRVGGWAIRELEEGRR